MRVKKLLSILLVLCMVAALVPVTANAMESEEEYTLFIAYWGDRYEEGDWGWQYYGSDMEGITSVAATVKSGSTATVSLTFDTANINSWIFAPCLVGPGAGENISNIDFTITCRIDGVEVPIDMNADYEGKTWWAEATGNYAETDCIHLAGGYSEWAAKFIEEPAGFTTIEYTITFISIELSDGNDMILVESTDEYDLFIAYGGDKHAENDWGWAYQGSDVEGITAVTASAKSGDTVTISLTFDSATINTWYIAPCLIGEGTVEKIAEIDFTMICKIDGVEVPIDMDADPDGLTWWPEGTGEYSYSDCIRLAGGYNEWWTKFIEEPAGFSTIEYTITFNSIKVEVPAQDNPVTLGDVNSDGVINMFDAAKLVAYYTGSTQLTEEQQAAADINNDGVINMFDAAKVVSYYTGKISSFE